MTTSRLLKKSASVVLASFRPSTYPSGLHSLRPCWTAFLSSLRDRTHVALAVRTFVCVRANIVFPQTARARMVAQYGAEGRERQGEGEHCCTDPQQENCDVAVEFV